MGGFVYILSSRRNGTLYAGVTSDLGQRIIQHREGKVPGFTRDYQVRWLVHAEEFEDIHEAIVREKRIKEWKRAWKIELIERDNPNWDDLAVSLFGLAPIPPRPLRNSRHPGESRDP